MYIVNCIGFVKCKLCKLKNMWSIKVIWRTCSETFVSSKEARVGVSLTGHSRSTSPVRRFDGIWFDCQPAFEIHTALDFKYPSYRGGKAGYQSLICMCRQLVFEIWQMQLQHRSYVDTGFVLHWCNSVMNHAMTDCLMSTQCESPRNSSPCKPVLNLIWSGIWVDSATTPPPLRWTFWNTFSDVPPRRKGKLSTSRYAMSSPLINGASIKGT